MDKLNTQQIIETAQRLIVEKNSTDISMSQIAKQLNVTHAAIYKHFENKDALWLAVAQHWFDTNIINKINSQIDDAEAKSYLHDWLWQFVNAKKTTFNENPLMFQLNTKYIDSNPDVLHQVLLPSYKLLDQKMNYQDAHYQKIEAIFSAFAVFALPNFSGTWNRPDYRSRFEDIWQLIEKGI